MMITCQFIPENCTSCSFRFALPEYFIKQRMEDHKSFYCPACGIKMYWPQLSDKERLLREKNKLKSQLQNVQECCNEFAEKAESLQNSNRALKGHITRLKKD